MGIGVISVLAWFANMVGLWLVLSLWEDNTSGLCIAVCLCMGLGLGLGLDLRFDLSIGIAFRLCLSISALLVLGFRC